MANYTYAGADISPDGRYRYLLWREWRGFGISKTWRDGIVDDGNGHGLAEPLSCLFVMLNPSTADGERDDPTIRRCVGFAKAWHYDRLEVVNLFAHRATKPSELLRIQDVDELCGVRNQLIIERCANGAGMIVCAWGAHGNHLGQDEAVMDWLIGWNRQPLYALGLTASGAPRHPLYVPLSAQPVIFAAESLDAV